MFWGAFVVWAVARGAQPRALARWLTRFPPPLHTSTPNAHKDGGALLVAPEWRLSLLLKRQELWEKGGEHAAAVAALDGVHGMPCVDVFDESDELLHHR